MRVSRRRAGGSRPRVKLLIRERKREWIPDERRPGVARAVGHVRLSITRAVDRFRALLVTDPVGDARRFVWMMID